TLVARVRVEDVAGFGERVQRRPALREVVRAGERDDRAEAFLLRRGARPIDAAHADAHEADAPEVETALVSREMVEEWSHDARPVGADRKTWRVLTLAWTVDRERGEPATEEIVLDRIELLLHRVEAGNEDDDRRM